MKLITSGRSELEGRRLIDLAERTELKIFSPNLERSIPREKRDELNGKYLENSNSKGSGDSLVRESNGLNVNGSGEVGSISG